MKSKKGSLLAAFVIILSMGFFAVAAPSATFASTTVYFDAKGTLVDLVASIEFEVLSPESADAFDFVANFPAGWFNFSTGKIVSGFDSTGTASLQNGVIGTFPIDVTLGNFELSDQLGNVIGEDGYMVLVSGSDYTVSDVPIPSALLLLGTGLVGLLGFRRKIKT